MRESQDVFDIRKCRPAFFAPHFCAISLVLLATTGVARRAGAADDSKPQLTPGQVAAYERLRGKFSLQGVAKDHYEVTYEDVLGLCQPLTQRMTLQAKNHPGIVFLHPDLSLTLGNEGASYAIGFALGTPAQLPKIGTPVESLHKGYQPIVTSRWSAGDLALEQIAFCDLPEADAVVTGDGKARSVGPHLGYQQRRCAGGEHAWCCCPALRTAARLTELAMDPSLRRGALAAEGGANQRCAEHESRGGAGALLVNGNVLLVYRANAPTPAKFEPSLEILDANSQKPFAATNGLCFDLRLQPKETRQIDFVVAGTSKLYPKAEQQRLEAVGFDGALRRAEAHWDRAIEGGMKLTTPEPRFNNMYRQMVLSTVSNFIKQPDTAWTTPEHCPMLPGAIWPWEFSAASTALDSLGYAKDVRPCLQYFVEHQSGVGKLGKDIAPDGDVSSYRGAFVGYLRWMNETGTVLAMFANHYRYSRDAEWLKANRPAILAAWKWIQKERNRTRLRDDKGVRVDYYGLLPKGRVHDWSGYRYHLAFTDGYTYRGMAEMAEAFREAGLPEAERFAAEAKDYRQCILDVIHRIEFTDPETGLLFIPNTVFFRPREKGDIPERGGAWASDGPRSLFDTGVLNPVADAKYWEPMLSLLERRMGTLGGLMLHFRADENEAEQWTIQTDSPFWYCNFVELGYYRDLVARGEVEKALLVFYTNLAYGASPDLYQTVERVNVLDSNYAPFQPNSSANGRILSAMRRMVIDEQDEADGVLWLLRACPRRWFAAGKSVSATDAPTLFGKMAVKTTATDDTITIDIDSPAVEPVKELHVALRHPRRQKPNAVTVNEKPVTVDGELLIIPHPSGHLRVVAKYAP